MESMKAVLIDNITYHKANHTPLSDKNLLNTATKTTEANF